MSISRYSLLGMEIILDTEKKSIGLVEPIAAADRVFSAREVYSVFKELWKDDEVLITYQFPLKADVLDGVSVANGWEVADEETKAFLSDDGSVRAAYTSRGGKGEIMSMLGKSYIVAGFIHLFVVRQWDGKVWNDITYPKSWQEAKAKWNELTENGTKHVDGDKYYDVFEARTFMEKSNPLPNLEKEVERLTRELSAAQFDYRMIANVYVPEVARLNADLDNALSGWVNATQLLYESQQELSVSRAQVAALRKAVKDATFFLRHSEGATLHKLRDYADDALTALTPERDGDTLDTALASEKGEVT